MNATALAATAAPTTARAAATAAAAHAMPADLQAIVKSVFSDLGGIFEQMGVAEEGIAAAQARHPRAADRIYHSFRLLKPTQERMETEFVYRSHVRELLDRVAANADTRPGTAAEVCCVMLQTSMLAPLRSSAAGLYMRMWQAAGFPDIEEFAEARAHHEALEKTVIDDHEQATRRRLADDDRRLSDITCGGLHHAVRVTCVYDTPQQLALTD